MKKFSKYFFLLILLLPASFNVLAQSEKRLIKEAEDAYAKGDKENALTFYLKALEKNPENSHTNFQTGKLYIETTYKTRSLKYLEKAYSLKANVDKEIHKYLGMSYHYNHRFDEAIEHYEKFKGSLSKNDPWIAKIERRVYECNNGKEFMENPVEAKVENLGSVINSAYRDFAPVISADESVLIFTSRREGSTGGEIDEKGEYHEDIYISKKVNGKWAPPENIGTNINTFGHDASINLSADGKELFIYQDQGKSKATIYYCKQKKDGTWSKPLPLEGVVNTKNSYENAVAISADGKKLFFASDRAGGFGKMDIWMTELDAKGNWGKAVNLGPEINTAEDEEGPFMDLDGRTLYFSSKFHKGMGGFDLFKSVYNENTKKWSVPENLGYPINSADDDIFFVLSGDGAHGYYASVKEDGYGMTDIYMITMPPREDYEDLISKMEAMNLKTVTVEVAPKPEPEPVKKEIILQPVILKGTITESPGGKTLSALVQLLDEKGNTVKEINTSEDGRYQFEATSATAKKYTISASRDGYGFSSKNVQAPAQGPELVELVNDLNLKKLVVGTKLILRNIYFDFDKATIKPESRIELEKLEKMMKDNPNIKVEISGHTDSKGSNEYNKVLSQKRAEAVVNYLVNKGISKSRMIPKGYGEEKPLASNDDEEEGREINRRTEFEILSQ